MVLVHRLLSHLSRKYIWIGKMVKGEHHTLYKDGKFEENKMRKHGISEDDLKEAVRSNLNNHDLNEAKEIIIEKNGELSVIKK